MLLLGDHVYQYHLKERNSTRSPEKKGKYCRYARPLQHETTWLTSMISNISTNWRWWGIPCWKQPSLVIKDTVNQFGIHDEHGDFWIEAISALSTTTPFPKNRLTSLPTVYRSQHGTMRPKGKVWIGADNLLLPGLSGNRSSYFSEIERSYQNEYPPMPGW